MNDLWNGIGWFFILLGVAAIIVALGWVAQEFPGIL